MHSSIIVSVLGLVASTSAHMKMSEPKGWFVNNSPLDPSGSDFPCKAVNYGGQAEMNTYAQGQTAPLTFIGQAVHGGGSCQVVLTTDTAPTKSSQWKVIKSIIGGCPAKGEAGNMGDGAEAENPNKYEFVIPEGIPAGKYTIAWTWFNKIGNREMYMNCGPAEITGDGGDQSFYDSLPDMFVANIAGRDCHVPDSKDVIFPNPGQFVESLGVATAKEAAVTPEGSQCGAAGAAPTATPTPEPASSGSNTDSNSGSGSDGSLPGGVFVTTGTDASPTGAAGSAGSDSAPAPTGSATLPGPDTPAGDDASAPADESAPAGDSAPAPAPAPADESTPAGDSAPAPSAGSGSSSGSGSTFAAGTACTQEGFWNCIGGSSFQRCASGAWSPPMALAAGTSCSGGMSENIAISRRGKPVRLSARMRL